MQMLINYGVDGAGACYLQYSPASNIIYLINDQGTAWSAGKNLGTAGTLANSQCQLNLASSSVSTSGNNVTANLALTFLAGLPGPQNVYMLTYEPSGLNTGWQQMGTWTTSSVSSQAPVLVSVSPTGGTGLTTTFSYTASSANGGSYIMQMHTLVNSSFTNSGGCYVYFDRAGNYVYLLDDSGGWTQYAYLGTGANLHNSQCTLNTAQSNAVVSGNNLTLNLVLTFGSGWTGAKNSWMYVYDRGDHAVGWSQMGTWTVGTPPAPVSTLVTPNSGNGASQVFTATFTDTDRPQDISEADFLINSSVSSAASCYVKWTPASNLYLMNDTGTAWLGPITVGSSATLQNNQCVLSAAASSVTLSGNGSSSMVTLLLGITFLPSFDGGKNLYTLVYGSGGNSGWQTKGTWLVEPPPPPVGTPGDPRRIGVRPTGAYWGAAGEQIDLVSFNLNFAVPLLKAKARGGWGVGFMLSYNSQLWRQDSTGTSDLIPDVGYGLGWRLQAGSVSPVNVGTPPQLDHYVYSDATGAQYKLTQHTNNVWTSTEGIYVSYDAAANRLYFPDGTFWVMGSPSAANEPDAGTLYPTLMEDTNGNQITVTYYPGAGGNGASNTSARINQILDARGPSYTTPPSVSYSFTYNTDTPPHLTGITNTIGTSEAYTFSYLEGQALYSPFSPPIAFGTTAFLQSVGITLGISHSFQYSAAGEMTQVTTPLGGILQWQYRTYGYANGLNYREVQTRQMKPSASGTLYTWNLTTDTNQNVHGSTTVADLGAGTQKIWTFTTTAGPPFAGLAATYEEHGTSSTLLHKDYTWAQNAAGNVYVISVATTLDPGTAYAAQTKTTQSLDTYGNIQVAYLYDYSNPNTPARTYSYSYITDPNYTSRYIRNRLTQATLTSASGTITLASNSYDQSPLTDRAGLMLHDAAYTTAFTFRGNPTTVSTYADSKTYTYEITGVVNQVTNGAGTVVGLTPSTSTNYSLPGVLTPNGNSNLATSVSYSSFFAVTSLVGPNGATTSTNYDLYGRPTSTSIPDGAVTNYSYTYNPNVQTATLTDAQGTRWTKTTLDGFGRTISVVKGHDNVPVSEVDTQYGVCACSPLGKISQVSQPYVPNGTKVWTTYTYDGSGRTLAATAADGSVTRYLYQGNNTTVTDPAQKWKTYTTDAFGNLTLVTEPRPGGGTNYITSYTYNGVNQLTNVQVIRDGYTQQRSFQWSGTDLVSATNPENGTVTYTYDTAHHVLSRTDAKGQVTGYSYDAYGRLTAMAHYPTGIANGADANQQVNYYYDTNPYGDPIAANTWGRLAAMAFGSACQQPATPSYIYMYGYNQAGRVSGQKMRVTINDPFPGNQSCVLYTPPDQTASYGWDNEGRMTSLIYPGGSFTATSSYNAMGQLAGMTDPAGDFSVSATYGTAGEMDSLSGGFCTGGPCNNLSQSFTYNSLWQLTGDGTTQYVYPAGQNNGRISQSISGGQTVSYTYDSLNRLATAQATDGSWGNAYSYDGFGNLTAKTVTAGSAPNFSGSYDLATNRGGGAYGSAYYDANGNPLYGTIDPATGNLVQYSYDVENRIVSAYENGGPSTGYGYGYDPQGKRILTQTSGLGTPSNGSPNAVTFDTFTFYGITGQRLSTFGVIASQWANSGYCNGARYCAVGGPGSWLYFGGRLISNFINGVMTDRLGSVRGLISYYPWGEEKTSPPTQDGQVKFGTYFRDMPGQDYADQRYYTATAGRFYTPDPNGSADPQNPITWNKYIYANDDPVNFNDPTGRLPCTVSGGGGDDGGGCTAGDEWWCAGLWDWSCFGDLGSDPTNGNSFAPVPRRTLAQERKDRAAEIAAAVAAIAKKLGDQVAHKLWPTAIMLGSMCSQRDKWNNYQLVVTYKVISDLGTQMRGSQLDDFSITESFLNQVGSMDDLNDQRGDPWSIANQNLQGTGTFRDYLSTGSLAAFPKSASADQEFTATGWFGTQPLDILGFGSLQLNGVNFDKYAPSLVTVNGMSASQPCGNIF
jgi:RHS repeat-associated protein